MLFALIARDKPDSLELRMATRQAHLDYVAQTGVVQQAGPILDDDGAMIGSLLILDLPDREAVMVWAVGDPYSKAGLFKDIEVLPWKKVIG